MKKIIALLLTLTIAAATLSACEKEYRKSRGYSFAEHLTEQIEDIGKIDISTALDVEVEEDTKNKRNTKYKGEWIDKKTAKKNTFSRAIVDTVDITEIYADCFFAKNVYPLPTTYKFNGKLSDEFCVGDRVAVAYKEYYSDSESDREEADFISVAPSDFELEPGVAYKPVIYLYPEQETEVSVTMNLKGEFTCTYPEYNNGWNVTDYPNGTLTDKNGQSYNYLYWEGELITGYDLTNGFCIKGEQTAEFLETALQKLGLNRREANEFIVYWLPLMQNNPYNIISFQTEAYTKAAELNISPAPDTVIRVFMTWQSSDCYKSLEPQNLSAPERNGFVAVEWGGTEIK